MKKIRSAMTMLAIGLAVAGSAVIAAPPALAVDAHAPSAYSISPLVWTRVGTYDTYDDCAYDGGYGVHRGEWKNYHCVHALKWELWVQY
jgi:hypothetical protein